MTNKKLLLAISTKVIQQELQPHTIVCEKNRHTCWNMIQMPLSCLITNNFHVYNI